ncbi:MAG: hypothetical protein ABFE01_06205 [Phycisphaerales bacterium]
MDDVRVSFDEAVAAFRSFLRQQEWSDTLLWLSSDRITGHKISFWLFRPEELTSDASSRRFYEHARTSDTSIRIDGLCQVGTRTLAYVQNHGGHGKMLNLGICLSPKHIHVVSSPFAWFLVRLMNQIRGEAPLLKAIRMPGGAES